MKLEVKHFFDAAHQLPDTEFLITKGCARLHGHTYKAIVSFEGKELQGGMLIDFKGIKNIIDELDHQFVNNIFKEKFNSLPSTSENITRFIHWSILTKYPLIENLCVSVCEGYKGEDRACYTTYEGQKNSAV